VICREGISKLKAVSSLFPGTDLTQERGVIESRGWCLE
jgi:hypothetical protein